MSLESLTDTVSKMNAAVHEELEVVTEKTTSMQHDFERCFKMFGERRKSTSPSRKARRGNDMDEDMEPLNAGATGRPPTPSSSTRPAPRFTMSSRLPPLLQTADPEHDRVVIFELLGLSTSWVARSWWSTFLIGVGAELPKPATTSTTTLR